MNKYSITVTVYVSEENEEFAVNRVHARLDVPYRGIDDYSIDSVEEIESQDEDDNEDEE